MRGVWTIALREIVERRMLLLAALVAGLFPFASPLFPGVRAGDWTEARDLGALIVSALFGVACAILLGATVVGRDLGERRLSFDFSRPVGSGGIWAGRLGGALCLSVLAMGVALLPTTAVGGGLFSASSGQTIRFVGPAAVAAMLVLVPLAHLAGVALRSRSAWLAVDLIAAGVVVLVTGATARLLYNAFAPQLLSYALIVLAGLTVPALWIASAAQVAVGRIDLRRGHAAQSCTLWATLLSLALLFAAFVGWVVSASPFDISDVLARAAPRGLWVAVTGLARARGDYAPLYLVNSGTGRYVRAGTYSSIWGDYWAIPVIFSRDGRRAVVFRVGSPRDFRIQLSVVDLDGVASAIRESNIVFPSPRRHIALSDNGTRLAVLDEGTLSVFDLDTGATLAAFRSSEPGSANQILFVAPDRVRVVATGEHSSIDELNITTRTVERHTDIAEWGKGPEIEWDAARDRYLVGHWWRSKERALLAVGRTGAAIRELPCAAYGGCTWRFLADGRIVGTEDGSNATGLHLLSADGDEIRVIYPPSPGHATLVRELDPGRLLVSVYSHDTRETYIFDLATGSWDPLPEDLDPIGGPIASEAGSAAAHLFISRGALVLYDPTTGSRRVVAGPERN